MTEEYVKKSSSDIATSFEYDFISLYYRVK